MRASRFLACFLFGLCILLSPAISSAATHRLVVAANPDLRVANAEVDKIIDEMNKTMATSAYPWDEACIAVRFERRGNVIQDSNLLDAGTHAELFENLRTFAPSAQVFVVSGINCSGVLAAGCGPIGKEPMIVGQYPDLNAQLWLHERGHNMGLKHSGESPSLSKSVDPAIGRRFMFWMLGIGHVGKTAEECKAFQATKLSSVVQDLPSPAVPASLADIAISRSSSHFFQASTAMAAPVKFLGADTVIAQASPPAEAQTAASFDAELTRAAAQANLTLPAFQIIGAPWVDGAPVDAIKNLSERDLDSVRGLLKGSPNRFWSQALGVLGIAGSAADVELIKSALEFPMPAVGPAADLETVRAVRNLTSIKLAAPLALGVLANRTKSSQAVDILKETSNLDRSMTLMGRGAGTSLSKTALSALAVADTPASKSFVNTVINLQQGGQLPEPITKSNLGAARAAPISIPEASILNKSALDVQQQGIDAYIKRGALSETR
ncbi:hypothetical protein SAMN05444748_101695 [Variovorax sp. OV700]|nr:hypothetical protein SAMN05444748_101695 [Variovorax sp. OV700]